MYCVFMTVCMYLPLCLLSNCVQSHGVILHKHDLLRNIALVTVAKGNSGNVVCFCGFAGDSEWHIELLTFLSDAISTPKNVYVR